MTSWLPPTSDTETGCAVELHDTGYAVESNTVWPASDVTSVVGRGGWRQPGRRAPRHHGIYHHSCRRRHWPDPLKLRASLARFPTDIAAAEAESAAALRAAQKKAERELEHIVEHIMNRGAGQ